MATWADQNAPEPKKVIPQCAYIVRRGQEPDFARRSNILPWQPALAEKSDKWAPLRDSEGKFISSLPPIGPDSSAITAPRLQRRMVEEIVDEPTVTEPAVDEVLSPTDMREIQIFTVFDELEPQDYRPNGTPKVDVVRARTGFEDLTGTEIKEQWLAYQKNKGA